MDKLSLKLPLELFMKESRNTFLSITPKTTSKPPKTNPYTGSKNIARKHNLRFQDDIITRTQREVLKIKKGKFTVSMSSSVLPQEEIKNRRTNPPTIPKQNKNILTSFKSAQHKRLLQPAKEASKKGRLREISRKSSTLALIYH